jgi:Ca2+-binding RTX toxin-like protein
MQRTIHIAATALAVALALQGHARAALIEGTGRSDVLVGRDDDNQADAEIQAGATANQSLDNADTIVGGRGDDILIGMLGSDVLLGGPGDDVMIGGIEGGSRPNQDIQIGDTGNDIAIWQAGDGSDLFDGGPGPRDTLVFGTIDRDANNVPIISPVDGRHAETGLPTANVSGQGGFCRLEAVADPAARGFEFLVRFFSRATGNLLVTVRTHDVEQVFCTTEAGGGVTFADLTKPNPDFVEIPLAAVRDVNSDVARMIR